MSVRLIFFKTVFVLKRLTKVRLTTVVAVSVFVALACLAVVLIALLTQPTVSKQDFVELDAIDNPLYLSTLPIYPDNRYKITKIFLEKSTLWFMFSNTSRSEDSDFPISEDCFLYKVNGTIRNDYRTEEIVEFSREGRRNCIVGLEIYLYDSSGNFVDAITTGNPLHGCFEISLEGDAKADFNVHFAVSNKNVETFEIYVIYLNPVPMF